MVSGNGDRLRPDDVLAPLTFPIRRRDAPDLGQREQEVAGAGQQGCVVFPVDIKESISEDESAVLENV